MNEMELKEKLDALLENAEFTDKIAMCSSVEEIASLLAENGVEISAEDLKQAMTLAVAREDGEELSDSELTAVSGGGSGFVKAVLRLISVIPKTNPGILPYVPRVLK